ncbi:MAG: hypothetical protein EXQ70_00495 [Solirubrobacterales bacterium]|nr:hypothetical protein [Solirubrobacterales bacterium]
MSQPPKPTEWVYTPRPSWMPALLAAGLAFVIVGIYAWWPYAAVGGLIALLALISWLRDSRRQTAAMPREQQSDSASIPLSAFRPRRRG